jgi:hypothetical protein
VTRVVLRELDAHVLACLKEFDRTVPWVVLGELDAPLASLDEVDLAVLRMVLGELACLKEDDRTEHRVQARYRGRLP